MKKQNSKSAPFFIAAAAALAGFSTPNTPQPDRTPMNRTQITAAAVTQAKTPANTQPSRAFSEVLLTNVGGGNGGGFFLGSRGCPPDVWGRSEACRRMRRARGLRRKGWGGAKI